MLLVMTVGRMDLRALQAVTSVPSGTDPVTDLEGRDVVTYSNDISDDLKGALTMSFVSCFS